MSGGSYNYFYNTLSEECEGAMYDEEMNNLIKDLCKVLHDLEWWQSCDISEEDYRKTVTEFKEKWFQYSKADAEKYIKEYCDKHNLTVIDNNFKEEFVKTWCKHNGYVLVVEKECNKTKEEKVKHLLEDLREHKIILSDLSVNEQEEICDVAISALSTEGEYIKKEDALTAVDDDDRNGMWSHFASHKDAMAFKEDLNSLPTYSFPNSVEDNTMEWIDISTGKGIFKNRSVKCLKCGNTLDLDGVNCGRGDANFCPNCGRKAVNK